MENCLKRAMFILLVLVLTVMAGYALSADKAGFADKAEAVIEKPARSGPGVMMNPPAPAMSSATGHGTLNSKWEWRLYRDGKLIETWEQKNLCTDEGLTYLLDVGFSGASGVSPWYVVIFQDDHTPAAADTYATPGFTECTLYDESTRPTWIEAGVSSKTITNSASKATFTISGTTVIYGAALVGGGTAPSTKGDTSGGGTLYNESKFSSSKAVEDDDVLKVSITLTAADN